MFGRATPLVIALGVAALLSLTALFQVNETQVAMRTQFGEIQGIQYGPGLMTSVLGQWQSGKQVAIWPANVATGKVVLPPAVKPAVQ